MRIRAATLLALLAAALAAAPAPAASITEMQCFQAPGIADRGCDEGTGLAGAAAAVVSPDGRNVYVGGNVEERGTLVVYDRDPATGALTESQCFAERNRDGCTGSEALFGVNDVTLSRDGTVVYALGILPGSVGVFSRDPATGELTPVQCFQEGYADLAGCPRVRFENPWKFALTADGRELVVLGSRVLHFTVGASGLLSKPVEQRVRGVRNPAALIAGRDARTLYAAGGSNDRGRVTILRRNVRTGSIAVRACAADALADIGSCRAAIGVDGPADLALSPDGRGLYLAASSFTSHNPYNPFAFSGTTHSSAITVFSPTRAAQKACLAFAGQEARREGCHHAPTARGAGFFGASAIAITPNGKAAVAGFDKSSAVALALRNPRTQALGVVAGRHGCVRDARHRAPGPRGCATGRGIWAPSDIAISPDSRNAYVTTPGGLVVFRLAFD